MLPTHWEAVKQIYAEGIATGNALFNLLSHPGKNGIMLMQKTPGLLQ